MVSTIRSMLGLHAGDDSLAPLPIGSNKNKRRLRKSRSRGLSSRDVFALTPAGGGRDGSRLAGRRCNRADQRDRPRGCWGERGVSVRSAHPRLRTD